MHQIESTGWFRLVMLWIGATLDSVFNAPLQTWVTVAVLILTGLQIVVTIKKLNRNSSVDTERGNL